VHTYCQSHMHTSTAGPRWSPSVSKGVSNLVAPPGDLAKVPQSGFSDGTSNGSTEIPENAIESGPLGTSERSLRCLRLVQGLRKVGLGALADGERPRTEFFLGRFSDCNVAVFSIPSMSNDDRKDARKSGDRGTCTMSLRGEVEFAGYLWSSGITWAQVAIP